MKINNHEVIDFKKMNTECLNIPNKVLKRDPDIGGEKQMKGSEE